MDVKPSRARGRPSTGAREAVVEAAHALFLERDYDEVPVAILEPHWDSRIVGTHSWAQSGDDIWLDGRLRKSHFAASWTSHLPAGGRSIALRRHRAGDFDARV